MRASAALAARKLGGDRLLLCASPEYLAARGAPRTPADLVRHECLVYSELPRAGEWRFRPRRPSPAWA